MAGDVRRSSLMGSIIKVGAAPTQFPGILSLTFHPPNKKANISRVTPVLGT